MGSARSSVGAGSLARLAAEHPCLVPVGRRFIIAGECDRVATPEGVVDLWRHWDQCSIDWHQQGHLMTLRSAGLQDRLLSILRTVGMA
jgi:hypothetical protein